MELDTMSHERQGVRALLVTVVLMCFDILALGLM